MQTHCMIYISLGIVICMKPKTKKFLNQLIYNPKISATQAYLDTHNTTNRASARASASKLLATPNVQLYMQEHVFKARDRIIELIDSSKEEVALRASESVLDRQLGKPIQSINTSNKSVYINIDLTTSDTP